MKFSEVYELIDQFAPFELSDRYCKKTGFEDNSGVIIDTDNDVTTVMFCLDLTEKAVEYAQWIKADVIVTHHPAIFNPIKKIDGALMKAANAGLGVIAAHINMDCAEYGVDHYFAKGIGAGDKIEILEPLLSGTGYGRRYTVGKPITELASDIEKEFNTKVYVYGDKTAYIKRVASFCGAGLDQETLSYDADLYVSADVKHHVLVSAIEQGKNVIAMTHYASENYGFKKICNQFANIYRLKSKLNFYYYDDERFL